MRPNVPLECHTMKTSLDVGNWKMKFTKKLVLITVIIQGLLKYN
jgi:hypothetical protein